MGKVEWKEAVELWGHSSDEIKYPIPSIKFPSLPTFSSLTGGLRPNEFSVLCGGTGAGKTTLLANLSADLVTQNIHHAVMSIETGPSDYLRRVFSVFCRYDYNTGDPVDETQFNVAMSEHMQMFSSHTHMAMHESRLSIDDLLDSLKDIYERKGTKLIFIDNVNFLLQPTRASDSILEMDNTVHELIMLVKDLPIHIVMVFHPRKTESGLVQSIYDVKGSSTSIQEAQNVFFWNKPPTAAVREGEYKPNDRILSIAKMRRRGSAAGKRLIFTSSDGVSYVETGASYNDTDQ